MEIAFVPRTKYASQHPGVFIFTDVARMVRPVHNLLVNKIEYIGSFEQVRKRRCRVVQQTIEE